MSNLTSITWRDRANALYLPLLGGHRTSEAETLVDELFQELVIPRMAGRQMRPSSLAKNRRALDAFLGDLCRFRAQARDGKHGMSPKDFSSAKLGFGLTAFELVKGALVDAGLIGFKNGYKYVSPGFDGGPVRHGGDVAWFRMSDALAARLGEVCGPKARQHWAYGHAPVQAAEALLTLRRKKVGKEKLEDLPFSQDEEGVREIVVGIEAMNAFLQGRVKGFAYGGHRRIYNDGDVAAKRWRRGGRHYSSRTGEAYEMMSKIARLEIILLDGEIVDEVDIRASHLTVLHAVLGLPFDPQHRDPYQWGEIDREAAKAFVTTSVGMGKVQWSKWPLGARDTYAEKRPGRSLEADYTVAEVRSAGLARYPFLEGLAELNINSLDLAWHEAELLTIAMGLLRTQGVVSLPVHDSLLVPTSKVANAKAALRRAFAIHFGNELVIPALAVTYGGPYAEALNI